MFPTDPIRNYINLAFGRKLEETAKAYGVEHAEIRRRMSPNSGMYFQAAMRAGVRLQYSKAEAYIEIVREACREANRPVDTEVRNFMLGEIHNICEVGKAQVARALGNQIMQSGMKFPDDLLPALVAEASRGISAIESEIAREFKIEEFKDGIKQSAGTTSPVEPKSPMPTPVPAAVTTDDDTPWYQTNLFWGSASLGITFVIAVIAGVKRDLISLLWFAWPFLVIASWAAISRLERAWLRTLFLIVSILGVEICLYGITVRLRTGTTSPEAAHTASGDPHGTIEVLPPTTSNLDVTVKRTPTQSVTAKVTPGAETKKQQSEPQSGTPAASIYNAPGGIIIPNNTGTVTNPTVNNFGPSPLPAPNVSACVYYPTSMSGDQYETKIVLTTDGQIPRPFFAFFFDGEVSTGRMANTGGYNWQRADKLPNPERTAVFRLLSLDGFGGPSTWFPSNGPITVIVPSKGRVKLIRILGGGGDDPDKVFPENISFACI
jgi:hypothetical protein